MFFGVFIGVVNYKGSGNGDNHDHGIVNVLRIFWFFSFSWTLDNYLTLRICGRVRSNVRIFTVIGPTELVFSCLKRASRYSRFKSKFEKSRFYARVIDETVSGNICIYCYTGRVAYHSEVHIHINTPTFDCLTVMR